MDELFKMKPEIFQTGTGEDEESADKKKGKKGKKGAKGGRRGRDDDDLEELSARRGFATGGATIGERLGMLYLKSRHDVWRRFTDFAMIVLAVSAVSLAAAFYLFVPALLFRTIEAFKMADLVILLTIIYHLHIADHRCFYNAKRLNGLRTQYKNIKRIFIATIRLRNKSIINRVVERRENDPV